MTERTEKFLQTVFGLHKGVSHFEQGVKRTVDLEKYIPDNKLYS